MNRDEFGFRVLNTHNAKTVEEFCDNLKRTLSHIVQQGRAITVMEKTGLRDVVKDGEVVDRETDGSFEFRIAAEPQRGYEVPRVLP